jgi:hypothetical protein
MLEVARISTHNIRFAKLVHSDKIGRAAWSSSGSFQSGRSRRACTLVLWVCALAQTSSGSNRSSPSPWRGFSVGVNLLDAVISCGEGRPTAFLPP